MRKTLLLVSFAVVLSACGGGGGGAGLPPVPPAAPIEDSFGAKFGVSFRANPNSDPTDPMIGDIIPVDPTKDPIQLP